MQKIKGKKVLITGASQGVGAAIAMELIKEKPEEIILVARQMDKLEKVAANLRVQSSETRVRTLFLDLLQSQNFEQLLREVPYVDILVNNAGVGVFGPLQKQNVSDWNRMMELNCTVPLRLIHHYTPKMKGGAVVNIASMAALLPMPYFSVYSATKAFLLSLGDSLAYELKEKNIHVVTVCPAGIKTDFHLHAGLSDEVVKKFGSTMLSPQQVAISVRKAITGSCPRVIPGFSNRVFLVISKFIPLSWLVNTMGRIYKKFVRA